MIAFDESDTPRRWLPKLSALAVMGMGLGLVLAARAGWFGEESWNYWLALVAAPMLVGLGGLAYLRTRARVRRESAWDIFVEREMDRESRQQAMAPPSSSARQIERQVNFPRGRHKKTRRHETRARSRA